jgi:ribosomal subunit interface protein
MTFPMIQYKATNVPLEGTWQDLVEQKFKVLEKYLGNETDVKCQVEFEKVAPHQNGDVHRVEANFSVRGKLYRAEATESSFELAIDKVREELDREMAKANEKRETLLKRGGQKFKNMLRFGK